MFPNSWSMLKKIMLLKTASGEKLVEETATGNPAVFTTDTAKTLKSFVVPFSDENGVTGFNAWQAGANLFDKETAVQTATSNYYINEGGELVGNSSWKVTDYLPVPSSITVCNVGGNSPAVCLYDKDKNFLTGAKYGTRSSETKTNVSISHAEACYCRVSITTVAAWVSAVQIVAGTEAPSEYTPYNGTAHQIVFPAEAGSPTAGQIDIVSGVLTVSEPTAGVYQMTGQNVASIVGVNTVWTDTSGSNTIKYLKNG